MTSWLAPFALLKNCARIAALFAAASVCFAQPPGQVAGQELSAEGKSKEVVEARAKRNAQIFQRNASVLTLLDRYGKRTGQVGERALYFGGAILSPDGKHIAAIKSDLDNESADLFVLDAATGAATRLTTSARTEWVFSPVWSPHGSRIAYGAIRKGEGGVYVRAANGQGPEELLYKNPTTFFDLSDWSRDGRFLTFAFSDIKGGTLYVLPLEGGPDRKAIEVFHSDLRVFGARFSPDGRYLSYMLVDKADKAEIFVRPADTAAKAGPWQISDGSFVGPSFFTFDAPAASWRRDGKELYYLARDQSMMVAEVSTSPSFSFSKPKALFRRQAAVPDRLLNVGADGNRFLVLPPALGQMLQQITIFNREGQVVKKVGEPALYSEPAFSPDGTRLLVKKNDLKTGQTDLWVLDIGTAKATRITNDTRFKDATHWSRDGEYILYTAMIDGDFPLFRKSADGTGGEELLFRYTPGADFHIEDIYQDGKFFIGESGGVIMTVPLGGTDPSARKPIDTLRDEFDNFSGQLSPDRRFLAFNSDQAKPEKFEVYVRPFDASTGTVGDAKWQVSKNGSVGMINWRGQEIFFRGQNLDSQDFFLMAAKVETNPAFRVGEPKLLFTVPGPIGGSSGTVSADGQRFVFAVNVPADKSGQSPGLEGSVKSTQPPDRD